jgi:hypothetical protein
MKWSLRYKEPGMPIPDTRFWKPVPVYLKYESGTRGSPYKIRGKKKGDINNPHIPSADKACRGLIPKNTSDSAAKVTNIVNR